MEKKLSNAPNGSIRYIQRKGNLQYYLRMEPWEKSGRYVRKSEKQVIQVYMQKSYNRKVLNFLKQEEKKLLLLYQGQQEQFQENIRNLYSSEPDEIKKIVEPIDMSDKDYAERWLAIPFEGKNIEESIHIYQTDKGEYVRSKSELTIANALFKYNIPYKYECPLQLKSGYVIYPDFTVLNQHTRKSCYWEHRGMMDDRSYAQNAVKRNKEYMKSGIMIGDGLVITEETLNCPLSTYEIEEVIKHYFL